MKQLITLLSIIVLSGTLNAQGLTSPQEMKSQEFQSNSDPFSKYELMLDDPCEDSVYKELQKMDIEEMSDRQFEIYKQKDEACNEYKKTEREMQAQDKNAENVERYVNSSNTLWWVLGIVSVASTIYYISVASSY